jgi:hypothetical protein
MNNDAPFESDADDLDYADLATLARTLSLRDAHLDSPPDDLWPAIERRVAAGEHVARAAQDVPNLATERASRTRRRLVAVGAVAATIAAAVGLLTFVARDGGPSGTQVDEVALTNQGLDVAGAGSHGSATLVRNADGSYVLDVVASDLPPLSDGFLELWIIDTSVKGMYSLGPLHGSGRYALPEHVDPSAFPIVDVSIEPADGVPAHSGKSILRGQLPA